MNQRQYADVTQQINLCVAETQPNSTHGSTQPMIMTLSGRAESEAQVVASGKDMASRV